MKYFYFFFIAIILSTNLNLYSQGLPGSPLKSSSLVRNTVSQGLNKFFIPEKVQTDSFATSVYTFGDITVFSYFDNTEIKIYDSYGGIVSSATLKADTLLFVRPGQGIYRIVGNITYTVLVGDAITNYVNGYFAVDEAGRGVSTKLNTWMMNSYSSSQDDFIVFAYEDNTAFTVKNLTTGNLITAGILNAGQHYSFRENVGVPVVTPLQVIASKGVSALSYSDQDYYVPSVNGKFTGTLFYGYSAYAGSWENSVTITSYSDNNTVDVVNTNTNASLGSFTLGRGQVVTIGVFEPTFWKVISSGPVSAANIPYAGWSGSYAYMTRAIDETGVGAGKLFFVPTINSRIDVFSFDNDNDVTITQLGTLNDFPYTGTSSVIWTGKLNVNENYNFLSLWGNYVYKIEGTKNLSVLQSNSGFGADFMPLSYALSLPDLSLSNSDIEFSIPDSIYVVGDKIKVKVKVHNRGTIAANNVHVSAYDGDPDIGLAPILGSDIIQYIAPGDSGEISFQYVIPLNPQYRSVLVKVDPNSLIVEANKSNNKALRFLRPNYDLQPPLSVNVTAPSGLTIVNGHPSPNPFTVKYDVFNTGNVSATNSKLKLILGNGLKLLSGVTDTTIQFGNIAGNQSASYIVTISANPDSSGFNFYSAEVSADNAELKKVNRVINIPDGIAPSVPLITGGQSLNPGCAVITWNKNNESDLAGYLVYYTTDSTNFNQNDPLVVVGMETVTKCDLNSDPIGTFVYFKLRAYDSSNNLSDLSTKVKVLVLGITGINDNVEKPSDFELSQNYPNPFNPSTVIKYSLPVESNVFLRVYDILGNQVTSLVNARQSAGIYNIVFDARNLANGIYFYSLQTEDFRQVKKLVLMK